MSVEDTNVIDFVAVDSNGDVLLVMVEGRHWSATDEQLFQLEEKINCYATFALDGELLEKYPELAGRPVRIELRCIDLPDANTCPFLDVVSKRLEEEGLHFRIKKILPTGS